MTLAAAAAAASLLLWTSPAFAAPPASDDFADARVLGVWTFSSLEAVAVDAAGNADPTPAVVHFASPGNGKARAMH